MYSEISVLILTLRLCHRAHPLARCLHLLYVVVGNFQLGKLVTSINTPFAPSASVLTLERVFNLGAENPSFRLCARHATLPETSRGATAG